ncbi:MAG: tetratricopeptide repeat protein, partial [Nitrosopumilus sp.]|nr:tetratricopeptide repeat protein [Nitrosopumilus sp.]
MGLFGFGKSKIDKRKEDWVVEGKNWCDRGTSLDNLGKNEEAIACYDEALSLDSTNCDAWTSKGNSLSELGKDDESIVCYSQAIRLNPEDLMAWTRKGFALNKLERYEESLECYNQV